MIRYFLILLFLKSILFGCSLCSIYTPKTHVSIQIKADKENIKTLKVNWVFANEFTKELLQIYDTNLNATFDEKNFIFKIEKSIFPNIKEGFYQLISQKNENKNAHIYRINSDLATLNRT